MVIFAENDMPSTDATPVYQPVDPRLSPPAPRRLFFLTARPPLIRFLNEVNSGTENSKVVMNDQNYLTAGSWRIRYASGFH
jgi:hypothetical protein